MAWTRVSDKLYQIQIDGKYVDLHCPFGKSEKIFKEFLKSGGQINEAGEVQTDLANIIHIISNFSTVGNLVLSTFGPKGQIIEEGDCHELSTGEVLELFEIAADITSSFMDALSQKKEPVAASKAAEKEPKAKKTKE